MHFWIFLGSAYVIGSIPFGYLIAKAFGVDILQTGSGNIGATNVQRTLGWGPGLLSLILDVAKGFVPVVIVLWFGFQFWQAAAIGTAVIIGHCWSIFLLFKGGKGISTSLGVILALDWRIGLAALVLWLILLLIWRYVSLASIISASILPFGFLISRFDLKVFVVIFIFAIIDVLKHIPNIKRLMDGTEYKYGEKAITRAD